MSSHKTTRGQLYELVWQKPLRKVAPGFGVSDVGLAKLCRRENIPLPGLGYWTKQAHGVATERPPLLGTVDSLVEIDIGSEAKSTASFLQTVSVTRLHPLAAETERLLSAPRPPSWKRIVQPVTGGLNVAVSKEGRRRALLIMSSLIATLEKAGATVAAATRPWRWSPAGVPHRIVTIVSAESEEVEIELNEPSQGKMQLAISGWLQVPRKSWNDTPKTPLEKQVGAFATAVIEAIPVARNQRLREEAEEASRLAAEEASRVAKRLREWEAKRRQLARKELRNLRLAADLRRYAELIAPNVAATEEGGAWVSWVRAYADAVDPALASSTRFVSVFDEPVAS